MIVESLNNMNLFNSIIHDIFITYKKIYKLSRNDKCYVNITPFIINTETLEEIHDIIYISTYSNTISKVAYGNKTNVSIKTINKDDKFYLFNIVNKSFDILSGYDILKIRKYIDFDNSKLLMSNILNKNIKPGSYIIGSGELALHIENYIISNILINYSNYKNIINNIQNYFAKIYNELTKNLSGLDIYFDLAVDINNQDKNLKNHDIVMRILLISDKIDNDQSKFETFKNKLLTKYENQFVSVDLKNLEKSVFINTEYGISILLRFTYYLELLFFITMLDTIKNI